MGATAAGGGRGVYWLCSGHGDFAGGGHAVDAGHQGGGLFVGEGDAERVVAELVVVQADQGHHSLFHGVHAHVGHGMRGLEELDHRRGSLAAGMDQPRERECRRAAEMTKMRKGEMIEKGPEERSREAVERRDHR